ncbi:MAG: PmbA/TldA family metallopeptidase [Gaiellaceae bacterium]
MRELCESAVEAALGAGASYADARAVVRRNQRVLTKNGKVESVNDVETEGIGVRVLVDGAWGFACDRRLTEAGAQEAARRAVGFARATPSANGRALAPVEPARAAYRTPRERDPVDVPLADKVSLCLAAEEALVHPHVTVTRAAVRA